MEFIEVSEEFVARGGKELTGKAAKNKAQTVFGAVEARLDRDFSRSDFEIRPPKRGDELESWLRGFLYDTDGDEPPAKPAPKVEVVSEGPSGRSVAQILADPPKLVLAPPPPRATPAPAKPAEPPAARDTRDHYPGARADFELAYGSYLSPKHPSSMNASWGLFKATIPDHATALKLRVAIAKYMAENKGSEYAYSFYNFLKDQWEGVYFAGRMLEEGEDGWAEVLSEIGRKIKILSKDVDAYWLMSKSEKLAYIQNLYYSHIDTKARGSF